MPGKRRVIGKADEGVNIPPADLRQGVVVLAHRGPAAQASGEGSVYNAACTRCSWEEA